MRSFADDDVGLFVLDLIEQLAQRADYIMWLANM